MSYMTQETSIALGLGIFSVLIYVYLFFTLLKRYFSTKYPTTVLMVLFSLIMILFAEVTTIISIYIDQTEDEIALILQTLIFTVFILSIYFVFLFSEIFEYDTILTRHQMIMTVITTIMIILILIGNSTPEWLNYIFLYLNRLDSLDELVIIIFPVIVGLFMLTNLYTGLKDSWITQKRQLTLMIVGTITMTILPLFIRIIVAIGEIPFSIAIDSLFRVPVMIGFLIFYFSFGKKDHVSLYNRRKADKLIVTDLNGLPLFVYDFKDKVDSINETLFAGAIVAITMLMAESLKSPAPIAEVLMKNKYRMVLESKSSFLALIMTPKGDNYLKASLEDFAISFEQKFSSIITSGKVIDLNLFTKSGIGILFEKFGIPLRYKETVLARIPQEEHLT